MSEHRTQGNIRVDGLAFTLDDQTRRLDFPRAVIEGLKGESGSVEYGAGTVAFDALAGRLKGVDWATESASAERFWLRDKDGRYEMHIEGIELPHGVRLTKSAGGGVELNAQHASLADVKLHVPDLTAFRSKTPPPVPADPPPEPAGLRQERLRFLDAIGGSVGLTIKVMLDLPVVGTRTLDQTVNVEIKDGAFDFKKLEHGLSWIEGAFLDIGIDNGRFRIGYGMPILGTKEIISFALDQDASAVAAFDRIPLRSLADPRIPGRRAPSPSPDKPDKKDEKPGRLRSLSVGDLNIHLSMVAPRNLDAFGGTIRFGGDDAPGIVDLLIVGSLVQPGEGVIGARAGAVDMTVKDLHLGGLALTADRLHVGPMDVLEVAFEGFTPKSLSAALHRVTATNLSLILGGSRPT
ncbi:MAG: hypothetical protein F9K40_14885 [Kofleriaceae bacterium]|nr:MAG: hypothetical protein F9K40_14885 [Kofleriaceae bacterium]MBZ0231692.1 hypothetical protein [Kofleriaceae bacterium]